MRSTTQSNARVNEGGESLCQRAADVHSKFCCSLLGAGLTCTAVKDGFEQWLGENSTLVNKVALGTMIEFPAGCRNGTQDARGPQNIGKES